MSMGFASRREVNSLLRAKWIEKQLLSVGIQFMQFCIGISVQLTS